MKRLVVMVVLGVALIGSVLVLSRSGSAPVVSQSKSAPVGTMYANDGGGSC